MPDTRIIKVIAISIILLGLLIVCALAKPLTRAWLDKNVLYVEYGGRKQMVDMEVHEAVISPDGEKIIYTKRTGGGVGDEGRTLFLYDPVLRLREPLFQFTDIIKDPTWIRRDERDFILYTRGRGGGSITDSVVLFDLGPRHTLLTFPGSITGTVAGGGVSYMTYTESGASDGLHEFYVDEFVEHGLPAEGFFAMASSQLETSVADYSPMRAFDGDWRTSWIEGVDGDGIGEWLEVEFAEPIYIKKIYVITGFHKTHADFGDIFTLNSRLRSATIEFDDNREVEVNFLDTKEPQMIDLGDGIVTKTVHLTIKEAYPGTEWDDLCISEIMFETG